MSTFRLASPMPVPAEALAAWHARPGAFERLAPPGEDLRVRSRTGGIAHGDLTSGELRFEIRKGPLPIGWVARHAPLPSGGAGFVDEQVAGPFARWRHAHRFEPDGPDASVLVDEVEYALPAGPLGALLGGALAEGMLARMFAFRHARTRLDLARHAAFAAAGPQRILISGASGLIGQALGAFLTAGGHTVVRLVRRPAGEGEVSWDPRAGTIDAASLEGFDAVIHLAGSNVGDGRWTPARKAEILGSRVQGTALLAGALAGLARRPRVLVCASGVSVYGDRGDAPVTEADGGGAGFLADVVRAWEAAAAPAREAGIRTAFMRTGVVLTPAGGAIARMLPPFQAGLGGPIGDGRQVLSWIALEDVVGAYHHALFDASLEGPVNTTAPAPATSAEFGRALGRVLHRPAVLPLPAFAVEAAFGEMGRALLLEGARVLPAKLEAAGFGFAYPTLEAALGHELGYFEPEPGRVEREGEPLRGLESQRR